MDDNKEIIEKMNAALPKWPQMIVTGAPVTEEQALEIIRRTDTFFQYMSGNDHDFIDRAYDILKIPRMPEFDANDDMETHQAKWGKYHASRAAWIEKWGLIPTEYVANSWISCSYIGGPHGWCHPDGTIGYSENVNSKWPSVEEVYDEWCAIAAAFPFLELEVSLMSGEFSEGGGETVAAFLIRNGKVKMVDPKGGDIHKQYGRTVTVPSEEKRMKRVRDIIFGDTSGEHAIGLSQLRKWHDQVFG